MRLAPAGTGQAAAAPAQTIRPASITTTAFGTGPRSVPSIRVAPVSARLSALARRGARLVHRTRMSVAAPLPVLPILP